MKCYYHQYKDAIGVCKTCYRGLCQDCAVDVGNGIACKGKCEGKVKELNATIEKSRKAYSRVGQAYLRNALIQLMLGLLFLIVGLLTINTRSTYGILTTVCGVILLFSAILNYSLSRKVDKQ